MEAVADVMTRCPIAVPADAPFATVAAVLSRGAVGAVPVVAPDGRLVGVVSEGDLIGGPDAGTTARELMSWPRTVAQDTPLLAAARLLAESGVRRLFVTENDRLVGVVSRRDLLTAYLRDDDTIRVDVERVLADQPPITVSVHNGIVLLLGMVEWRSARPAIDQRVRAVPGVVDVRDRLGFVFDDGTRRFARSAR